jgi:hypothetical protein
MIETLAFRTQARTVDHLGREQIADCPTAVSELWKNAYDAYARNVSLHIFDDAEPVAAIFDDGHGMNYDEFVNRWLVIGTDSKFDSNLTDDTDRDGLPKRTKQGQKGIGRLSSANLGPLLLIVSKRKHDDFIAALIDWRIFENPYLVLSDIQIPVTRFRDRSELFPILPDLFDKLTDNIWGSPNNPDREARLKLAWDTYDRVTLEADPEAEEPSKCIAGTIINAVFEARHLDPWLVWNGARDHGTALVVSEINYDLRAQLPSIKSDANVKAIREAFFATLSAFTDPYVDPVANEHNAFDPDFTYEVKTWVGHVAEPIVEDERSAINRSVTEEMEHVLSGNVDADGVFRGQVKAFGEWRELGSDYVIYPPKDYKLPKGPTTFVGPFGLHVATYERIRKNSTLTDADWGRFEYLAEQHGGFLLFRNGLRVLPYGRTDNDFFEIETRRSISAGREFWNARRMFGRVSISREKNPNLRDKAGREGFIDNRSAKALRVLVVHILRTAAYSYFGQASDLRQQVLPEIQARNAKERAEGRKLKHICDDLNRRGIDSPKGGKWAPSSLVGSFVRQTGMLRQTLYNGVVTFNKMQYRKHPENGKRLSIMRPEKEWITVPIPELTIIDDETFAKVQKSLDERSSKHLQRKMMPTLMTEDEKRETSIRRSKEWRRKQAVTKKRANAMFGGKLYCGEHNEKITATYAKHYSCSVKGCANRNLHYDEIIKLVLDAVTELDETKIVEHFESEEIQQVRANHTCEIERLTGHLEDLRSSISKVIDALGPDARSKEIRAFFDDKSEMIHRAKLDISRHQRELTEMTVPKRLDRIVQRHNVLVARLRIWSRDPEAIVPLRHIIKKITIETIWDDDHQSWHRACEAAFDYAALIATAKR